MSLSPDGKTVAVGSTDSILRRYDVATGDDVSPPAVGIRAVHAAAMAPDGQLAAIVDGGGGVGLWDVRTGHSKRGLTTNLEPAWQAVFSPDGQTVAAAGYDSVMRLYRAADGRLLSEWKTPHSWGECVQFAPDGRALAWADITGVVSLLEPATGKVRLRIATPDDRYNKQLRWAPDGALLATAHMNGQVRLWDSTTGKLRRELPDLAGRALAFAFSPDGKAMASVSRTGPVVVWEVGTGKERMRLAQEARWASGWGWGLAFLPGGRALAVGRPDGCICVHDLATGKERYRLEGHRGAPTGLAFSPDCRFLLSTGNDLTALIWDLSGLNAAPPAENRRLAGRQLEGYWSDLAGDDAAAAYRAMVALRGAKDGVPFLKEQLVLVSRSYPERARQIARLIAALDSERFDEREAATKELKELRDDAEPQLRQALAGKPSPEARRRAEEVLQGMEGASPGKEWLRLLRAIEVLEASAAPEAREALEVLAKSSSEARLPLEAKASIERLDRKPAAAKP
jgi:hypothetical protein